MQSLDNLSTAALVADSAIYSTIQPYTKQTTKMSIPTATQKVKDSTITQTYTKSVATTLSPKAESDNDLNVPLSMLRDVDNMTITQKQRDVIQRIFNISDISEVSHKESESSGDNSRKQIIQRMFNDTAEKQDNYVNTTVTYFNDSRYTLSRDPSGIDQRGPQIMTRPIGALR